MKKILAVDDTKSNLRILMELLDETYELLVGNPLNNPTNQKLSNI